MAWPHDFGCPVCGKEEKFGQVMNHIYFDHARFNDGRCLVCNWKLNSRSWSKDIPHMETHSYQEFCKAVALMVMGSG